MDCIVVLNLAGCFEEGTWRGRWQREILDNIVVFLQKECVSALGTKTLNLRFGTTE